MAGKERIEGADDILVVSGLGLGLGLGLGHPCGEWVFVKVIACKGVCGLCDGGNHEGV